MSETQRSGLKAFISRTRNVSKDIVVALATSRPEDLDPQVADPIDEILLFPLPSHLERFKLLKLHLEKYISEPGGRKQGVLHRWSQRPTRNIQIKGLMDGMLEEAAAKTDGFSGREIAVLIMSIQAEIYGSGNFMLDPQLFHEVVDYRVAEHLRRKKLVSSS